MKDKVKSYLDKIRDSFGEMRVSIWKCHEIISKELDMSKPMLHFFTKIMQNDDSIKFHDISKEHYFDKAHVSRSIKKLEEADLITVEKSNNFNKKIILTKKGEEYKKILEKNYEEFFSELENSITEEELDMYLKINYKITNLIKKAIKKE